MTNNNVFEWAMVGAGPAGIAAVGCLIDQGVKPEHILWVDPEFQAGDLGQYWRAVSSNTKAALFQAFLTNIHAFQYDPQSSQFALNQLNPDACCLLDLIAEPLCAVTQTLKAQVSTHTGKVLSLKNVQGAWQLHTEDFTFNAKKVILATGAIPNILPYEINYIPLTHALDPKKLSAACQPDDTIAVFGSSHSAMIIIRFLIAQGAKRIINFYRSPLKYAVHIDDWVLFDNTGLKGDTAQWVKTHVACETLPQLERYRAIQEHIDHYLPECDKAIYATGFTPRHLPGDSLDTQDYNPTNGIIAPGLFGVGIAYPQRVIDPLGNEEMNVGLWKFLQYLKTVLPIWMQY